ncbi:MAG: septum site-determining protein MinC [Chloroflexota bacterium]
MQASDAVIIKGVREGLLFIVDDSVPFAQILSDLVGRFSAQPYFFKGASVTLNMGRRVFDAPEFDVLYRMLARNGMKVASVVSLSAQSRMVSENAGISSRPPSFAAGDAGSSLGLKGRGATSSPGPWSNNEAGAYSSGGLAWPEGADPARGWEGVAEAGVGLFLRCSLRPGQSVRYGGDVCIMGDVEMGAEVVAEGDVVVWGALRGVVHAGVGGDDEAVVCALKMNPTQLGVAGILARFPGMDTGYLADTQPPEMARLEGGRIVVEAWRPER